MAAEKRILLLAFLFLPLFLTAQENSGQNTGELEQTTDPRYYYEITEDGTALFTQRIGWKEIPGSYAYELIVRDGEQEEIYRLKGKETFQELHLHPGLYEYSVVIYNMLDKPEIQTPWTSLEIIKAEMPVIRELSPEHLYVEEGQFKVYLEGEKLFDESEYWLVNPKNGKTIARLEEISVKNDKEVRIRLPDIMIRPGDFRLKVVNPGGLNSESPSEFHIRYLKPFDISLSLGYAPFVSLYNSWFQENWEDYFYPLGAIARVDFFFIKRPYGYFGVELEGRYFHMEGGIEEATILSDYYGTGLNFLYKYLFSSKFHAIYRLGAGVFGNIHSFDYSGTEGESLDSLDPYFTSGISLQYYFTRHIFTEASLDWIHIFHNGQSLGGLQPSVSVGYSY